MSSYTLCSGSSQVGQTFKKMGDEIKTQIKIEIKIELPNM